MNVAREPMKLLPYPVPGYSLVYAKEYRYYKRALNAERQLKKLTRGEKEELVRIYAQRHESPP